MNFDVFGKKVVTSLFYVWKEMFRQQELNNLERKITQTGSLVGLTLNINPRVSMMTIVDFLLCLKYELMKEQIYPPW